MAVSALVEANLWPSTHTHTPIRLPIRTQKYNTQAHQFFVGETDLFKIAVIQLQSH